MATRKPDYMGRVLDGYELTPRERELITLVRRGLTNREIAGVLTVSEQTVKGHLKKIFQKAGVKNRTELIYKLYNL